MTSLPHLLEQSREQLLAIATERGIEILPHLEHDELVAKIVRDLLEKDEQLTTDGVLAVLPDGFGFVRMLSHSFAATAVDAYVSASQVRSLNLRSGHRIRGPLRAPRGTENFFALLHVDYVQDAKPEELRYVTVFEARTAIVATRKLPWCPKDSDDRMLRALQILAPIRFGHRALLHAPANWPRARLLARIAASLRQQQADLDITVCLLDQRPEDITSIRSTLAELRCDVFSTAFAARPDGQVMVADMALQRAMRQVEHGRDALLLVDSLTALTRARSRSSAPSGAWIQPGLDAQAILTAKQLFAHAQQCAEGGSLTILATVVAGQPGTIDDTIEREFATCTNSDLVITDSTTTHDSDVLPFDPIATRTRPEDDATPPAERARLQQLRRELAELPLEQRTGASLGI